MTEKYGIQECKDVMVYVRAVIEQMKIAKADDGKIDKQEMLNGAAATVEEAARAAWGSWNIGKELGDLNDQERQELFTQSWDIIMSLIEVFMPKG